MLVCSMYVYHICIGCPQRPEEAVKSPGAEVADSCELPCECWGLTQVLCNHSKHSSVLSHLSSLQ